MGAFTSLRCCNNNLLCLSHSHILVYCYTWEWGGSNIGKPEETRSLWLTTPTFFYISLTLLILLVLQSPFFLVAAAGPTKQNFAIIIVYYNTQGRVSCKPLPLKHPYRNQWQLSSREAEADRVPLPQISMSLIHQYTLNKLKETLKAPTNHW